jgi:hypothetical protein
VHQLTSLHAACEASFLKDLQWTADCRVPLELEKTELQLKLEKLAEVRMLTSLLNTVYLILSYYWRLFLHVHL